jgi:hypothetical protein
MKYGLALAVGEMASSKVLPSLATVVDLFLPMWGMNRDCLKPDFSFSLSFFGVFVPSEALSFASLLPSLLIRKKFLIRWPTSRLETPLLLDRDTPLNARFSLLVGVEWPCVELNN